MEDTLTRREFIKRSALLGLGLAGGVLLPSVSEAVRFEKGLYKVTRTQLLIGTVVSITVLDQSRDRADDSIGSAFQEIKRMEQILSRFKSDSAVGLLNQEGRLRDIPDELKVMIKDSTIFYGITKGAFDITVKPVLDLYESKFRENKQPTSEEIDRLMEKVGTEHMRITEDGIFFEKEGMGITLDGIAKGYIVDMAGKLLEKHGVQNYLINAGGDIRVKGERKEGGPWKIAIQDPQKKGQYPDVIHLKDAAIATSGNYEVFFDNEKIFHHIVDPKSGRSPLGLSSVSVVAKDTKTADALSTALYVMGHTTAIRFAEDYGCDCLLVTDEGKLLPSKGWKALRA